MSPSLIKKISRVLAAPQQRQYPKNGGGNRRRQIKRSRRTFRVQRRRFNFRPQTVNSTIARALPAAYASHVRPRFNVVSRGINSVRVSGCDLVYPIPNSITSSTESIFSIIPANPAYWLGTKIGQFAPAYMNYRPIAMTFSYIPQVAVTQEGTVFMGTLWNGAPSSTDIQQSLFTSNGGCLTQCYVPCDTSITLGTNLPQNLFTLAGSLSPETNPFVFVAGVRPAVKIPGYFYVTYTYEFKNPIGTSWKFFRSGVQEIGDHPGSSDDHTSLVVMSRPFDGRTTAGVPVGTIMDVESDGVYYSGTKMRLNPETMVIYFSCTNTYEITYPVAGSADAILVSSSEYVTPSSTQVVVPLTQFNPVVENGNYVPIVKDGVTYDKVLVLTDTAQGVNMQKLDLAPSGTTLSAGQRFAYLKENESEPGVWARIWDTTKSTAKALGMGLLAGAALGSGYYVARQLFPTKYFAQAPQSGDAFINLQAPQARTISEDVVSSSSPPPVEEVEEA